MTALINRIKGFSSWKKSLIAISFDIMVSALSFILALYLRLEEHFYTYIPTKFLYIYLGAIIIIQFCCFYTMGLYRGIWRFSSTPDLVRIIKATSIAVLASFIVLFLHDRLKYIPRSIFLIDWCLLILSLGGGRFAYRLWTDNFQLKQYSSKCEDILIVGAGNAGVQLLREINNNTSIRYNVVGFIDDDKQIQGKTILNIPIIGTIPELQNIIERTQVKKVFIALPKVPSSTIRKIVRKSQKYVDYKILPVMSDILDGKVHLSQLRDLNIVDLLGRDPISLDTKNISNMLSNKIIMITGAGGSIGSEICNQVSAFNPKMLIAFEQSEFNLYDLEKNLNKKHPELVFVPVIGDVRNKKRVKETILKYRPQVIFHAAAYKHVPIMESNPSQCIETNVLGTKNVAEAAREFAVDKFIMISTDKAVNPTNIMGASKRVAEMFCQYLWKKSQATKFITVRFGNVLGSSGSVIPLFKKQIEDGGPLTVTHKDIKRYFMSIPEASQLVLQAGAQGNGGEIFILDMGEPIRIIDLAKQMIRLSGYEPYEDIQIKFTGLRPGEKLFEELLMDDEKTIATSHPKVRTAKAFANFDNFEQSTIELLSLDSNQNSEIYKIYLKKLVPEYMSPEEHIQLTHNKNIFQ